MAPTARCGRDNGDRFSCLKNRLITALQLLDLAIQPPNFGAAEFAVAAAFQTLRRDARAVISARYNGVLQEFVCTTKAEPTAKFAATAGILPYGIGFLLKFFTLTSIRWIPVALVGTGLVGIVTGQSLVLYSRLHLIVRDSRTLRWVLTMIIFDAIVFHIPTMIMNLVYFMIQCIIICAF